MQPIYDIDTFRPSQGVGAHIGRARRTIVEAIDRELAPLLSTSAPMYDAGQALARVRRDVLDRLPA